MCISLVCLAAQYYLYIVSILWNAEDLCGTNILQAHPAVDQRHNIPHFDAIMLEYNKLLQWQYIMEQQCGGMLMREA